MWHLNRNTKTSHSKYVNFHGTTLQQNAIHKCREEPEAVEDMFKMHYESDSDDENTSSAIKRAGDRAKKQKELEKMVKADIRAKINR